ncbi:hypothetical protein OIO90_004722 [Microbotryomycetes sp. JL221]|nr:hypothetical protein OIO90_004722 [Microbotryomycetes sp. JL221]
MPTESTPQAAPPAPAQSSVTAQQDTNPLEQKQLSDLTDYEIAQLTQSIKEESAVERPLVGQLEPLLDTLTQEYTNKLIINKVKYLDHQGYTGLRRARGDGDCFYRSFAFSYVERLLPQPPSAAQLALAKIESLLPLLDQAGFMKDIYDDFYEPLKNLLVALGSQQTTRPTNLSLHESFNDPETSNAIVVFLRLLTSAYLKANAEEFEPFLFSLEDDPRFIESGRSPTIQEFCSLHVEPVQKEADHIQISALTRALSINLKIAYLDQSQVPIMFGNGGGGGDNEVGQGEAKVNFVQFEEGASETFEGALLYRPGHYDILYK